MRRTHENIENIEEFLDKDELRIYKVNKRQTSDFFDFKYSDTEKLLSIELCKNML